MGFTADGDEAAFKRRRSVELKHGRISMLACMGYFTPEITGKLPGELSPSTGLKFADIPNGIGAISKVPALGWAQIIAYFGFVEFSGGFNDYKTGTPGDYGWKVLSSKDPDELNRKLNAEIANSRLAMTAIMAMIFQNGTVGTTGPEMWLGARAVTQVIDGLAGDGEDNHPRAIPAEWAVNAPANMPKALVGTGGPLESDVWDPLQLMKGKSEEQILRWRAVELKHGRVAMLAVVGWAHVAAGWHIVGDMANGYVSVSDDPLVNVSQLTMGGAWQVVFTIMCLEWLTNVVAPPPKEAPWDVVGWSPIVEDSKQWRRHQLRELNNGRLAMFAILGLIAQDAYTGDYGKQFVKTAWFGALDVGEFYNSQADIFWQFKGMAPGPEWFAAPIKLPYFM
jgi:hypothetical protein